MIDMAEEATDQPQDEVTPRRRKAGRPKGTKRTKPTHDGPRALSVDLPELGAQLDAWFTAHPTIPRGSTTGQAIVADVRRIVADAALDAVGEAGGFDGVAKRVMFGETAV